MGDEMEKPPVPMFIEQSDFLYLLEQEMSIAGYHVGEGFHVNADLKSVAKTIQAWIDRAYEQGFRAGGGRGHTEANAILVAQLADLARAAEGLIFARYTTLLRERIPVPADEWKSFLNLRRALGATLSGGSIGAADHNGAPDGGRIDPSAPPGPSCPS